MNHIDPRPGIGRVARPPEYAHRNGRPGDGVPAGIVSSVSLAANDIHQTLGGAAGRGYRGGRGQHRGGDPPVRLGQVTVAAHPEPAARPDRGDISLDGRSVLHDDPDQLRQRIGMVF